MRGNRKTRAGRALRVLLTALLASAAGVADAVQLGHTASGRPFATGGVSLDERQALHAQRGDYDLWVVTAVSKSGAYLANVRLRVRDAQGRTEFDGPLDGPWLFIDLAPGRHELEAVHAGQTRRRTTTLRSGERRQVFFYFDTGDEVGSERIGPPSGNPFDGPPRGR